MLRFCEMRSLTFILPFLQVPYSSPVSVAQYPTLAVGLTAAGLAGTAVYFVYQMKGSNRNVLLELLIALAASTALGFGTFFMMLSFGLYV